MKGPKFSSSVMRRAICLSTFSAWLLVSEMTQARKFGSRAIRKHSQSTINVVLCVVTMFGPARKSDDGESTWMHRVGTEGTGSTAVSMTRRCLPDSCDDGGDCRAALRVNRAMGKPTCGKKL